MSQSSESIGGEDQPLIPYVEYINSADWSEMRIRSSHVWGNVCLVCGEKHGIDRHHLFYRYRIENGHPSEIIPLCRACHDAAHVDGDNKNTQPTDKAGLDSIVNRLFYRIIRTRGFPTIRIGEVNKVFWKVFGKHVRALFKKEEPKIVKVVTQYKTRSGFNSRKKSKKRNGKRKYTPDELVLKSNAGAKNKGFRTIPRFKMIDYKPFCS